MSDAIPPARRAAVWLTAAVLAATSAPTLAAEPKDAKLASRDIDMPPVGLPIVWRGRLVNYVFVKLRLSVGPRADLAALHRKEPYFRDALVRAAARTPFVLPWDFTHVDEAAITRTMTAECAKLVGPGQIVKVSVLKATPQRTNGLPRQTDREPSTEDSPP